MIRTIIKKVSGLSCIAGIVYALGIAGASDLHQIDFKPMILKVGVALLLIGIGYIGLKANGCME